MNDTTQWRVDKRIAERPKLLIWSENTYTHKERKNQKGMGKVASKSRR
jgi:hypothetical protein